MNIEDELKQLELATSRGDAANLDAETAALREGWRVLAGALEKSSGPFDEAALVAKLQRELAAPSPAANTKAPVRGWIVVALLGGALAASLFVMVAISGGWFKQPIVNPKEPPKQIDLVKSPETKGAPVAETPAWDDALDTQISVAASQMQSLQKPALPLDASISTLNYHLQQMAQDMDEGAL